MKTLVLAFALTIVPVTVFGQTRFYPSHSTAAGISPTPVASWEDTGSVVRRTMAVTTPASSGSGSTAVSAPTGTNDVLIYQQILCDLDAQTIDGTIKGQFRASEANTGLNLTMSFAIWVSSSDGTTSRGTLVAAHADNVSATPPEFASSLTNRRLLNASESTPITLSSVDAQDGDCLIFEIGYFHQPGISSQNGSIGITDNSGSDLAEDDTTTTADNSWFELSDTVTFGTPASAGRPSVIGGGIF